MVAFWMNFLLAFLNLTLAEKKITDIDDRRAFNRRTGLSVEDLEVLAGWLSRHQEARDFACRLGQGAGNGPL